MSALIYPPPGLLPVASWSHSTDVNAVEFTDLPLLSLIVMHCRSISDDSGTGVFLTCSDDNGATWKTGFQRNTLGDGGYSRNAAATVLADILDPAFGNAGFGSVRLMLTGGNDPGAPVWCGGSIIHQTDTILADNWATTNYTVNALRVYAAGGAKIDNGEIDILGMR